MKTIVSGLLYGCLVGVIILQSGVINRHTQSIQTLETQVQKLNEANDQLMQEVFPKDKLVKVEVK